LQRIEANGEKWTKQATETIMVSIILLLLLYLAETKHMRFKNLEGKFFGLISHWRLLNEKL
jgi:hypothetical protein